VVAGSNPVSPTQVKGTFSHSEGAFFRPYPNAVPKPDRPPVHSPSADPKTGDRGARGVVRGMAVQIAGGSQSMLWISQIVLWRNPAVGLWTQRRSERGRTHLSGSIVVRRSSTRTGDHRSNPIQSDDYEKLISQHVGTQHLWEARRHQTRWRFLCAGLVLSYRRRTVRPWRDR
jgi:hypothetical protein